MKFEWFGQFHEKDYNASVQELVNDEVLNTEHGKKRFNDDTTLIWKLE